MKLLALLLSLFLLIVPCFSATRPYIAVFASPDFWQEDWKKISPDLYVRTSDWRVLDSFLERAKTESAGREIVIDIQCHGNSSGISLLGLKVGSVNNHEIWDTASLGYVVNHIERVFPNQHVVICLEACFAAKVYKDSIRNTPNLTGNNIESCDHTPIYPIYGMVESFANYNNLTFLQYMHGIRCYMKDLRQYEFVDHIEPANEDSEDQKIIEHCWLVLQSFGI